MKGNFSTQFIYPEILITDQEKLALPRPDDWEYKQDSVQLQVTKCLFCQLPFLAEFTEEIHDIQKDFRTLIAPTYPINNYFRLDYTVELSRLSF